MGKPINFGYPHLLHGETKKIALAMGKGVFVEYADSEGPDQPPNPRSQGFRYQIHYENTPVQIC